MQPPVIFLIGPPQHGKSTARQITQKLTGLQGASCSDVIYAFLAERRKTTYEELKKIPKEEFRETLIKAGDWLCGMDGFHEVAVDPTVDNDVLRVPSSLIRTLYQAGYRVIDGARRALELEEAKKHLEWNGVRHLTIWLERTGGPDIKDSTTVTKQQADEVITNDGSEADLTEALHQILLKYFSPPPKKEPEVKIFGAADAAPGTGQILDSSGNVAGAEGKGIIKPFSAL
jgi:hypothetical protein